MTNTLFDKPIHGTISYYADEPGEQHDPAELLKALDHLLELEEVHSVRWRQYTPYFNDGDACVFNVHEPEVLLTSEALFDEDEDDYDQTKWRSTYDLWSYGPGDSWEERRNNSVYEIDGVNTEEVERRLGALGHEMNYHDVLLHKKFGDPAEVIYDGEKFTVEHYDHD